MGAAGALVPILSAALTAAGTGYAISSNQATANKENNAVAQELQQQQQFQRQANNVVQPRIKDSSAQSAQSGIDKASADQLAQIQRIQSLPLQTAPSATPNNAVLGAESQSKVGGLNQAAAHLAGYGTWENAQNIATQNANDLLSVINTNSGNAAGTLPYQVSSIENNGQTGAAIGSLASSAGALGSNAYYANQLLNTLKQGQSNNYFANNGSGLEGSPYS